VETYSTDRSTKSDLLPLPVLSFDNLGRLVYLNEAAKAISATLVVGQEFDRLFESVTGSWAFESVKTEVVASSGGALSHIPFRLAGTEKQQNDSEVFLFSFSWERDASVVNGIAIPGMQQLLEWIHTVNQGLQGGTKRAPTLTTVATLARKLAHADRAYLKLFDPDTKTLRFEALSSIHAHEKFKETSSDLSRGMTGHVFRTKKPYRSTDVRQEPPNMYHALFPDAISKLVVPLLVASSETPLGILAVESKLPGHFDASTQELLVAFAVHAVTAIQTSDFIGDIKQTFDHIFNESKNARARMSYNMLHDTKNMLRTVIRELQEIHKDLSAANLQKRRAAELEDRIAKMIRFNDGLALLLEDIQQGESEDSSGDSQVDLREIAQLAIDAIPLSDPNIQIGFEPPSVPCLAFGTRARLLPALYNLIVNAVRAIAHSHRPGTISVSLSESALPGFRKVVISDTGPGLPRDVLNFVRRGELYSGLPGGTGLGLITVREAVESLKGHLQVDSRFGEGTTFTLELKGP